MHPTLLATAFGGATSIADLAIQTRGASTIGLAGVNAMGAEEEATGNVRDAVDFIAELRQVEDLSTLPVGRHVVVIGGGMTAVDAAVQSKLLGAEDAAMVYRRGRERMNAFGFELDHAASKGVRDVASSGGVDPCGTWSRRIPGVPS